MRHEGVLFEQFGFPLFSVAVETCGGSVAVVVLVVVVVVVAVVVVLVLVLVVASKS